MQDPHLQDISSLSHGMDVIIISVTSIHEQLFWQKRLDQMRGQIIKEAALILIVFEDWAEGAGNALGTFYAFEKANAYAKEKYHLDLIDLMTQNKSIALYHTAGKGTRLAPMTGCEYNSKSRIKLVGNLYAKNRTTSITLLEAVIKQTSILAPVRRGRLNVFWGDQLFIPSFPLSQTNNEIDLLVKPILNNPSQQDWVKNDFSKYGFVIVYSDGSMKQLEKLSYEDFSKIALEENQMLAFSLGSFSLSKNALTAFLEEFAIELKEKKTSLDSDPHLWMPLTLDKNLYSSIMARKDASSTFIEKHWNRMQKFKARLVQKLQPQIFIGASKMGEAALWWDYGNLKSYYENSLKLTENGLEGQSLKKLFAIPDKNENHIQKSDLQIENSILINCSIHHGQIKNSVLIDVIANEVNAQHSVLINSSAQVIEANEAILYNCLENGTIKALSNQIRADNFSKEHGHIRFFNTIHPHLSWDQPVEGNPLSFKDLHQMNQTINPDQGQHLAQTMHNKVKQAVFDLQK